MRNDGQVLSNHRKMPPSEPSGDQTVHGLLMGLSLPVLLFWCLGVGFGGDRLEALVWTLLLPAVGVVLAISRRRWAVLAVYGAMVVLYGVLILFLA